MITINRTAEEWRLYSDMPNAGQAADVLNTAFNQMINDIDQAIREFESVTLDWEQLGATDTEPRYVWQQAIFDHVRRVIGVY